MDEERASEMLPYAKKTKDVSGSRREGKKATLHPNHNLTHAIIMSYQKSIADKNIHALKKFNPISSSQYSEKC